MIRRSFSGPRPLALAFALLLSAPLEAGRFPLRSYDLARGLAGDKVWDLELDAAGALWVATTTGVSRFDGVRFRNFDARHGLPHGNVVRLLRLADGRLVAGTGAGIAILDPIGATGEAPWRAVAAPTSSENGQRGGGQLIEVVEQPDGSVWAGGVRGLFRVEGSRGAERLVPQPLPAEERSVRLLAPDGEGGLWVGFEISLRHRSAAGAWGPPRELPAALTDPAGLSSLKVDAGARLWVASRRALCAGLPAPDAAVASPLFDLAPVVGFAEASEHAAAKRSFCVDVAHGLPPTRIRRLLEGGRGGGLFVVGSEGLVEIDAAGGLSVRVEGSELRGASLQSVLAAPDGGLWLGTAERGLFRWLDSGPEILAERAELGGNFSTLLVRGEEVLIVVDHLDPSRRLLRFAEDRFVDVTPPGARALQASWGWGATSMLAPDGAWWTGITGGVASFPRLASGVFKDMERPLPALQEALAGHEPIRIFAASDGALWVASHTPPALHRADGAGGAVESFPEIAGFPGGAPSALTEDGDGSVWVGFFSGGLARRSRSETSFEWLGAAQAVARGFVYQLHFDRGGQLWVAAGGGLVVCRSPRERDPRCERARPGSDLDQVQVMGVIEDRLGRIVAATARGLYILDADSGRLDVLTTADGLPGNNLNALAADAMGDLWIASETGIARLAPTPGRTEAAPVRIVALEVAGRARPVALAGVERLDRIELAPGERSVEIEFASVHLGADAPPYYQYRVGGGAWSAPSYDRRLRLAGLEAGTITVEARAVSSAGVPQPATARLELRVLPPFWRRGWFLLLLALALAGGLALAYRLRVGRLLALERVRTRIAADLHDDLGSSLSRISILAEVAKRQCAGRDEAESTLETIGASARELAEMASDIVWAIDPQRDDLASWVARVRRFGSDLFEPDGVAFDVVAPEGAASFRLPAATRRDLYLVVKEGLNNAAKYSGARRVHVEVSPDATGLAVTVEDDGRGFGEEAVAAARARGGGHGLASMAERAQRLGGRLEISAPPAGGTRISFSIPL